MLDPKKITKIQIKSGCGTSCEYLSRCGIADNDEFEVLDTGTYNECKKANHKALEQCRFSVPSHDGSCMDNGPYMSSKDFNKNGFVIRMSDGTFGFILESNVECMMEFPRQLKESVTKKTGVFSRAFINKVAPDKSPCDIEEKSPQQKPEIKTELALPIVPVSIQNYRGFSNL